MVSDDDDYSKMSCGGGSMNENDFSSLDATVLNEKERVLIYRNVELKTIAFGSCHKNEYALQLWNGTNGTIWDAISNTLQPDIFLWTGDAVYMSSHGKRDPLAQLEWEYQQMLTSGKIGYKEFLSSTELYDKGGVHGTWDDHDYGSNDAGKHLHHKLHRQQLYHQFLRNTTTTTKKSAYDHYHKYPQKNGLYKTILYENLPNLPNTKVKLILLDTRSGKDSYCPIPGIVGNTIPFAAILSSLIRYISSTSSYKLINYFCSQRQVLDADQWSWLEQQFYSTHDTIHILVSSIQVLTTNPLVESWGHFPFEKQKLLHLLNNKTGVILLSGDVHHAEISSTIYAMTNATSRNTNAILEVTSSGLTHSCTTPSIIGKLACQPILNTFTKHRHLHNNQYYTKRNFGSIDILTDAAEEQMFEVKVHDYNGNVLLRTGPRSIRDTVHLTDEEIHQIAFSFSHNTNRSFLSQLLSCCFFFFFPLTVALLLRRQKQQPKQSS